MTLHIIDPFKRTTYLRSNESYPSARSHPFCFLLQLTDSNSYSNFLSHVFICNIHGGRSLRDKGKVSRTGFLCKGVSRMSPCGLTGLLLAPWWARLQHYASLTGSLLLSIIVLSQTHTHTEPSCRLAHMSSCERHKQFVFFSFFCARREKYFRGTNWEKSVRKGGKIEMETEE